MVSDNVYWDGSTLRYTEAAEAMAMTFIQGGTIEFLTGTSQPAGTDALLSGFSTRFRITNLGDAEVSGALEVGTEQGAPTSGMIRYTGVDFEGYDGVMWNSFTAAGGNPSWELTGNAGTSPGIDFVGTTDAASLVFATSGTEYMRIDGSSGGVGIGTVSPVVNAQLTINGPVGDYALDITTDHGAPAAIIRQNGSGASLQLDASGGGFAALVINNAGGMAADIDGEVRMISGRFSASDDDSGNPMVDITNTDGGGGLFVGSRTAVFGTTNESGGLFASIGVQGTSIGNSTNSYGVYGRAQGSNTNYGVYGEASGGTTNWAGFFQGDVNMAEAQFVNFRIIVGNDSYQPDDYTIILNSDPGIVTLNLPDANSNVGRVVVAKVSFDAADISITPSGGDQIELLGGSLIITKNTGNISSATLLSIGGGTWLVIDSHTEP